MILDIYTRVVSGLPYRVKGFVIPCEDGYCIYINADLSDEEKRITYEHEIEHIRKGHLDSDVPVHLAESEIA